jgi:hypothetical protein
MNLGYAMDRSETPASQINVPTKYIDENDENRAPHITR